MTVAEVSQALKLEQLGNGRKWHIQGTNALTGDGLYEGLDWISRNYLTDWYREVWQTTDPKSVLNVHSKKGELYTIKFKIE